MKKSTQKKLIATILAIIILLCSAIFVTSAAAATIEDLPNATNNCEAYLSTYTKDEASTTENKNLIFDNVAKYFLKDYKEFGEYTYEVVYDAIIEHLNKNAKPVDNGYIFLNDFIGVPWGYTADMKYETIGNYVIEYTSGSLSWFYANENEIITLKQAYTEGKIDLEDCISKTGYYSKTPQTEEQTTTGPTICDTDVITTIDNVINNNTNNCVISSLEYTEPSIICIIPTPDQLEPMTIEPDTNKIFDNVAKYFLKDYKGFGEYTYEAVYDTIIEQLKNQSTSVNNGYIFSNNFTNVPWELTDDIKIETIGKYIKTYYSGSLGWYYADQEDVMSLKEAYYNGKINIKECMEIIGNYVLLGDANKDDKININDVSEILSFLVSGKTYYEYFSNLYNDYYTSTITDYNQDKITNIKDVTSILKYLVKIEDLWPNVYTS